MKAAKGESHIHWTTPEVVLERLYRFGTIKLDPCTNAASKVNAQYHCDGASFYGPHGVETSSRGDGLQLDWSSVPGDGYVYVNPPYASNAIGLWATKVVEQVKRGEQIVALVAARPSTHWFGTLMREDPLCLFWGPGRLQFDNPPPPTCVARASDGHKCGGLENDPVHRGSYAHAFKAKPETGSSVESLLVYFGGRISEFTEVFQDCGYVMTRWA